MSLPKTGHQVHDDAVLRSESARQFAVASATGASAQPTVTAAEIAYYRAALASAVANGVPHGNLALALRSLGVNA
jgi:hypothetical protein